MAAQQKEAAFLAAQLMLAATLPILSITTSPAAAQAAFVPPAPLGGARVTGMVTGMVGSTLQVTLRSGRTIAVNLRVAHAHDLVPRLNRGEFVQIQGHMTGHSAMTAAAVMRAKSAPAAWAADIP